jgi:nucleoside-diphosphate-sugar epimerase
MRKPASGCFRSSGRPMNAPLEIVLLGGTGFAGSAVLQLLTGFPGAAVRVHTMVRDSAPGTDSRPENLRLVTGDVRHPPAALFPNEPHVVIHLATKQIDTDSTGFDAVNVEGTRALMAALPDSTRGILYGSSASVYGQGEHTQTAESAPLAAETPLARSRLRAEQIVLDRATARSIAAYCLRPRFVFGRDDRHTMPGLIRMVRRGIQPGAGTQRYTILDVEDYARVMLRLSRRILDGAAPERVSLNAGYRRGVSLDQITGVIRTRFGLGAPFARIPFAPWEARLLRAMPGRAGGTLATRLELFGLSHTFSVDELCLRVGNDIADRDPVSVVEAAVSSGAVAKTGQSASGRYEGGVRG